MIAYAIVGFSLGLSAGISPGPLFAMVLSQTIRHGLKEGLKTAFSPLITDLPIVLLSTVLLSTAFSYKPVLGLISIAGGFLLLSMAYENWKVHAVPTPSMDAATSSITQGALVNALSPHPFLFWLMVGSPIILTARSQGWSSVLAFISGFYVALVGAKMALAFIANRSRTFLQGKAYSYLMKILALLLLVFSFLLFKEGIGLLF